MYQAETQVRKDDLAEACVFFYCGASLGLLSPFDQWMDDESLLAGFDLAPDEAVGALSLAGRQPLGLDRDAPGRMLSVIPAGTVSVASTRMRPCQVASAVIVVGARNAAISSPEEGITAVASRTAAARGTRTWEACRKAVRMGPNYRCTTD